MQLKVQTLGKCATTISYQEWDAVGVVDTTFGVMTTLIIGASENPARYSNKAALALLRAGHEVLLLGRRKGVIAGIPIQVEWPHKADVHTITMYINKSHQPVWYEELLASGAKRIIFNPGAENQELVESAHAAGMETMNACTLVLLSTGAF